MYLTRAATGVPEDRITRSGPSTHRFYYRSADVAVTDQWFATPERTYTVIRLDDVRTARGGYHPMVIGTAVVAVIVVVAAGASLFEMRPMAWPATIGIALVPIGVAVAAWRLRPRPFELWAGYDGDVVQLFRSADEKTFGHVCRALIRAREHGITATTEEPESPPAA